MSKYTGDRHESEMEHGKVRVSAPLWECEDGGVMQIRREKKIKIDFSFKVLFVTGRLLIANHICRGPKITWFLDAGAARFLTKEASSYLLSSSL